MAKRKYVRKKRRRRRRKANKGATLNPHIRYQKGLSVSDIYPYRTDGVCRCGCNLKLEGKSKSWFSKFCRERALTNFWVIKGDTKVIREELYKIDKGVCRECKTKTEDWDADHIVEVMNGGSACDISGFQTLCKICHKAKTKKIYE